MKVTIDRSLCDHALSECERCFARFVQDPLAVDRTCIIEFVEDADPVLYLKVKYDGMEEELVVPPEKREEVATTGWSQYVKVKPRFYRE